MSRKLDPDYSEMAVHEAFKKLGDKKRIEIIRALGEAGEKAEPGRMTYSELKEEVGIRNSSKFNYHLQQLVGHYIWEKGETEMLSRGYGLRYLGLHVYSMITSGFFHRLFNIDPFEIDQECYNCGSSYEVGYRGDEDGSDLVVIECPDCEHRIFSDPFPASGIEDREVEEFLYAFDQWTRNQVAMMRRGVCPLCSGEIKSKIERASDTIVGENPVMDLYAVYWCSRCEEQRYLGIGTTLLDHPVVVSFFYDHGTDVSKKPVWEFEFAMTDNLTEVISDDPWKVEVRLNCSGEQLTMTVDENLDVVETSRQKY